MSKCPCFLPLYRDFWRCERRLVLELGIWENKLFFGGGEYLHLVPLVISNLFSLGLHIGGVTGFGQGGRCPRVVQEGEFR